MNKYGKVLLPFITPFKNDESVDVEKFKELINYAIDRKYLDSIVVSGTTGEFNTLTFDERVSIFEAAKQASKGYPVIAGTGCGSTRETVSLTKEACKMGIDACLIVSPYYCKPTQKGVLEHYKRIADETDAKIIIYNIPIFTGINIEPKTVGELVKYSPQFIGIKDESGVNPTQIMDYQYATKEHNPDFLLFNGDDIMLLPTLALGAIGIVSGGALILGDIIKKVFDDYECGNTKGALDNYRIIYLMVRCFCGGGRIHPNPMLRAAVSMTSGIDIGYARMPLDKPSEEELESIRKFIEVLNEHRKTMSN